MVEKPSLVQVAGRTCHNGIATWARNLFHTACRSVAPASGNGRSRPNKGSCSCSRGQLPPGGGSRAAGTLHDAQGSWRWQLAPHPKKRERQPPPAAAGAATTGAAATTGGSCSFLAMHAPRATCRGTCADDGGEQRQIHATQAK